MICGAEGSKYDFKYISEFNYETWREKIREIEEIQYKCIDLTCYLKDILYMKDLSRLVQEIDTCLGNLINIEVFVRMSYRSPKDVPGFNIKKKWTGRDILELITQSQRCIEDIKTHLYHTERGMALPRLNLILCQWKDFPFPNYRELRCFIYNKKLVAVSNQFPDPYGETQRSQWNSEFGGQELFLIQSLFSFVSSLYQKCPLLYNECVLDVAVSKSFDFQIVEFNPYFTKGSTSAVLFDWEKDRHILEDPETHRQVVLRFTRNKAHEIIYIN